VKISFGPDGKNAKQEVFASAGSKATRVISVGRTTSVLAKDGSDLVADDWAGAIYSHQLQQ